MITLLLHMCISKPHKNKTIQETKEITIKNITIPKDEVYSCKELKSALTLCVCMYVCMVCMYGFLINLLGSHCKNSITVSYIQKSRIIYIRACMEQN